MALRSGEKTHVREGEGCCSGRGEARSRVDATRAENRCGSGAGADSILRSA